MGVGWEGVSAGGLWHGWWVGRSGCWQAVAARWWHAWAAAPSSVVGGLVTQVSWWLGRAGLVCSERQWEPWKLAVGQQALGLESGQATQLLAWRGAARWEAGLHPRYPQQH